MTQMTTENPRGLDGFEFAEFTSPKPDEMTALIRPTRFAAETPLVQLDYDACWSDRKKAELPQ